MTDRVWAGIDVGKEHHWLVVVDTTGRVVLSRKVFNDEAEIAAAIEAVNAVSGQGSWTVDLSGVYAALLLTMLWQTGQPVHYLAGRSVHRASLAGVAAWGQRPPSSEQVLGMTPSAAWRVNLSAISLRRLADNATEGSVRIEPVAVGLG